MKIAPASALAVCRLRQHSAKTAAPPRLSQRSQKSESGPVRRPSLLARNSRAWRPADLDAHGDGSPRSRWRCRRLARRSVASRSSASPCA